MDKKIPQQPRVSHPYEQSIFLNCPFDEAYRPLLFPLLFTTLHCGFFPRIASERFDSRESRLQKIAELIECCQYSIHDISRLKSDKAGEYFRLNMPFEIGLDVGCKLWHPDEKYRLKHSLILEPEPHSLHRALSDLGGMDVKCHENDRERIIYAVRNWLSENGVKRLPGPHDIWQNFNYCALDLVEYCTAIGFGGGGEQIHQLPIPEMLDYLKKWLITFKILKDG